jgi:hypothetical protein
MTNNKVEMGVQKAILMAAEYETKYQPSKHNLDSKKWKYFCGRLFIHVDWKNLTPEQMTFVRNKAKEWKENNVPSLVLRKNSAYAWLIMD